MEDHHVHGQKSVNDMDDLLEDFPSSHVEIPESI